MGPLHSKWRSVGVAFFLQIQILSRDIAAQFSLLPFTLHCFHDASSNVKLVTKKLIQITVLVTSEGD